MQNILLHIFIIGPILRWLINNKRRWSKNVGIVLCFILLIGLAAAECHYTRPPNHYDLLNVPVTATKLEIQAAFRKLSLRYHPDRNKSPEANEIFRRLRLASEVLSNTTRRKNYHHFGDFSQEGKIGQKDMAVLIVVAVIRCVVPFSLGLLYTAQHNTTLGRNIYITYLGFSVACELIIRFQPQSIYTEPAILHWVPLLPFEGILLLKTLINAVLNAVLSIGPYFDVSLSDILPCASSSPISPQLSSLNSPFGFNNIVPSSLSENDINTIIFVVAQYHTEARKAIQQCFYDIARYHPSKFSIIAENLNIETIENKKKQILTSQPGESLPINKDLLIGNVDITTTQEFLQNVDDEIAILQNSKTIWNMLCSPSVIFFGLYVIAGYFYKNDH